MSERLTHWEGEPVEAWRAAWGAPSLEVWSRVGSTSDRALVLAAAGSPAFALVIADEQTAGRGRRGAGWHSPPGSGLWMSVVLPAAPLALHLPLLVGLAVAEAAEGGGPRIGIKWPNDLLIEGRKVGGILCESVAGTVVAGIGLNVRTPPGGFPEELQRVATSLEESGAKAMQRSDLAGRIVRGLEEQLQGVRGAPRELGADALAALRARDVLLGRRVRTDEHGPGTASGIDPDGAFVLEREGGSRVRVLSGSIRPL